MYDGPRPDRTIAGTCGHGNVSYQPMRKQVTCVTRISLVPTRRCCGGGGICHHRFASAGSADPAADGGGCGGCRARSFLRQAATTRTARWANSVRSTPRALPTHSALADGPGPICFRVLGDAIALGAPAFCHTVVLCQRVRESALMRERGGTECHERPQTRG
eukprot:SAG11_NODE_577_length_8382_cov_36.300374_6_plen_162_part_00